ncbi:MAG: cell division topological specificity factor MinE [Eubacterium sp.]|nr:cell division topological specificity factor MinE [Eubacterium sp.]
MKRFGFFRRKTSGKVATERLRQLLLNDRMNLSTELTERIHKDLVRCISKYLEIDETGTSVQFETKTDTQQVYIKVLIPVKSMKQRR